MPIYPNRAVNKSKYYAFTEGKEITSNSGYKGKNKFCEIHRMVVDEERKKSIWMSCPKYALISQSPAKCLSYRTLIN